MIITIALIILVSLMLAMLLVLISIGHCHKRVFDQVLAINLFGTLAIGMVVAIGMLLGHQHFIDIALLYALINFVATIVLLRMFNKTNLTWLNFSKERER